MSDWVTLSTQQQLFSLPKNTLFGYSNHFHLHMRWHQLMLYRSSLYSNTMQICFTTKWETSHLQESAYRWSRHRSRLTFCFWSNMMQKGITVFMSSPHSEWVSWPMTLHLQQHWSWSTIPLECMFYFIKFNVSELFWTTRNATEELYVRYYEKEHIFFFYFVTFPLG